MKNYFKNLSIRKKYTLISHTVVFLATVTTLIALGIKNNQTLREDLTAKIEAGADVIASNSVAALDFGDRNQAEIILSSLINIPEIIGALINDLNGAEFTMFKRFEDIPNAVEVEMEETFLFRDGYLYVKKDIEFQNVIYGSLHIIATTDTLSQQRLEYIVFALIVLAVMFVVTIVIGGSLSKSITDPIVHLSETAATISRDGEMHYRVCNALGK